MNYQKNSCKVSIIIPCYNNGDTVGECLDSCLKQTYQNIEVILVNDGCTDRTESVAKRYKEKVKYIKQENLGTAKARNKGAMIAEGDWFLFLDADDILLSNAVHALITSIPSEMVGVIFGITYNLFRDGRLKRRFNDSISGPHPIPAINNFKKSLIVTPGAAIIRKDVFFRVKGFQSGLEPSEDRHFWLKCGATTTFSPCEQIIVVKRVHSKMASGNKDKLVVAGLLAQMNFLSWCDAEGIKRDFIDFSLAELYEMSLYLALSERAWKGFDQILLLAKKSRVNSNTIAIYKNFNSVKSVIQSKLVDCIIQKCFLIRSIFRPYLKKFNRAN